MVRHEMHENPQQGRAGPDGGLGWWLGWLVLPLGTCGLGLCACWASCWSRGSSAMLRAWSVPGMPSSPPPWRRSLSAAIRVFIAGAVMPPASLAALWYAIAVMKRIPAFRRATPDWESWTHNEFPDGAGAVGNAGLLSSCRNSCSKLIMFLCGKPPVASRPVRTANGPRSGYPDERCRSRPANAITANVPPPSPRSLAETGISR